MYLLLTLDATLHIYMHFQHKVNYLVCEHQLEPLKDCRPGIIDAQN